MTQVVRPALDEVEQIRRRTNYAYQRALCYTCAFSRCPLRENACHPRSGLWPQHLALLLVHYAKSIAVQCWYPTKCQKYAATLRLPVRLFSRIVG